MLIECGADINALDFAGYTPLHIAAKCGSDQNTLLLLENDADPNVVGHKGKTPIHKAKTQKIVHLLLKYGANAYAKMPDDDGHGSQSRSRTVFDKLLYRNPQIAEGLLDAAVDTNGQDLDSDDLLLIFDLEIFYHEGFGTKVSEIMDEVAAHAKIFSLRKPELLHHPLSETLLLLKWNRCKKIFFANLFLYTLFVACLTTMAILQMRMMVDYDEEFAHKNLTDRCHEHNLHEDCYFDQIYSFYQIHSPSVVYTVYTLRIVVAIQCFILFFREMMQAVYSWRSYCRSLENLLEQVMIWSTILYLIALWIGPRIANLHLASWSVFLAWVEMTLMIGRSPRVGIYIYMFTNVIRALMRFLLLYSPTIIAFAIAFHLLLPHTAEFGDPVSAFLKVTKNRIET